jgi:hypothetical protein
MEGLSKLTIYTHFDVETRKCDGLRVMLGDKLIGEIDLDQVLKIAVEVMEMKSK